MKIAIIVPVFYRKYLRKCLKSILQFPVDVIIINDSNLPLECPLPRVTVINNQKNLGIGVSRNKGVKHALDHGYSLIGFVDADSVLSKDWLSECMKTLRNPNIDGVSGLAMNPNQRARIARIKYLFKEYSRRTKVPFQVDCSLFRCEVFQYSHFGITRYGEDSFFLQRIDPQKLAVNINAISYHHEVESVRAFFKKELLGALYSRSSPFNVAKGFLLTPVTCIKMLARWKSSMDYPLASLVWLVRQILWTLAYAIGQIPGVRNVFH